MEWVDSIWPYQPFKFGGGCYNPGYRNGQLITVDGGLYETLGGRTTFDLSFVVRSHNALGAGAQVYIYHISPRAFC